MYNLNVGAMLVTLAIVSAVLGWAVIELLLWFFSHLHFSFS